MSDGSTCSGTLITPNKVLTAAHCLCGKGPLATLTFPQNPFPGKAPAYSGTATLHPMSGCTGVGTVALEAANHDIAIVALNMPVSPALAKPVAVNLGDAMGQIEAGEAHSAQIAGYGFDKAFCSKPLCDCNWLGGLCAFDPPCQNNGTRRHGPIPALYFVDDPDDSTFEGLSFDSPLYGGSVSTNDGAVESWGDSGGPLFADFAGTPMVFGVFHGWFAHCGLWDKQYWAMHQYWAT